MGKLPPSLRSAKVPIPLLKSPAPPSTPPPPPSPSRRPPFSKSPLKVKKKHPKASAAATPPPSSLPRPQFFHSPLLTDAISTFNSLASAPSIDHNSLLQSYCNAGATPADSLSFFRHVSSGFTPTRSTFHILLGHACLHPSAADPSPVIDLMVSAGFPPNAASADLAVRALCSADRVDDACSLLRRLTSGAASSATSPDRFTYNFLIRRLARSHPITTVYSYIEEISRLPAGLQPDVVTYTILIETVCRGGNLREATRLLSVLSQAGFKPDCYLYNVLMKGYCTLEQYGLVMDVYNRMKDEGIEPDLVTYNTLVYGLSKGGMVEQAKKFLDVMEKMGHFPDTVTYTSLMSGLCRKGNALGALNLLKDMEEKGCPPNECTYNTLLMGLSKCKILDKAIELYKVMTADGMKLESPTYATFVRALCRSSKVAEAFEVFDYARESKSLSEVTAYIELENSLKWLKKMKV